MGFFGSIVGAVVKTALTPITLVQDVVDVVQGEEPDNTIKMAESIVKDVEDAVDELP